MSVSKKHTINVPLQIEEYKQWLEDIGFKILEISADFLDEAPTEESERIVFVAQK